MSVALTLGNAKVWQRTAVSIPGLPLVLSLWLNRLKSIKSTKQAFRWDSLHLLEHPLEATRTFTKDISSMIFSNSFVSCACRSLCWAIFSSNLRGLLAAILKQVGFHFPLLYVGMASPRSRGGTPRANHNAAMLHWNRGENKNNSENRRQGPLRHRWKCAKSRWIISRTSNAA